MLLKTILNHCHKFKSFVYKKVHLLTDDNGNPIIIVDIEARANGQKLCSRCYRPSPGYDRLKPRTYKFIPLWGIPVLMLYALHRVTCRIHGVVAEYIPWTEGKNHLTNVFKLFLSYWAKYLSWSTVAKIYRVQWYHVFNSVKWVVEYGLDIAVLQKSKP
jgi:transposase